MDQNKMEQNLQDMRLELALFKQTQETTRKDIEKFSSVFSKMELSVDKLIDAIRMIAVQEKMLENNEKRLTTLEKNAERYMADNYEFRKEIQDILDRFRVEDRLEREKHNNLLLTKLTELGKINDTSNAEQEKRIKTLESWQLRIMGGLGLFILIVNLVPWDIFF